MALSNKHPTIATLPNDPSYEIGSDAWNQEHAITVADKSFVGKSTAGAGAVAEIDMTTAKTMLALTLDDLSNVDTVDQSKNDVLKFNGTGWVAVPEGTSFTFAIASFTSNAGASPQEIGTGVWKAIGALSFSATYSNGPATGGYVSSSGWSNLTMGGVGFIGEGESGR